MKKVSAQAAQSLLQEQRAWIQFKDAACKYYASGEFGREGQVLSFGACKGSIIADRVATLNVLAAELKERTDN